MALLPNRDREDRPWGSFERFTHGELSTVKIITVLPGKRLSLQYHHKRAEFWRVLEGSGTVTLGDTECAAKVGDEFEIAVEMKHRLAGGEAGITILEIGLGDFDEADIVRVEDDFGRTT
jgi:mannose-1-phosphate guanylyltransferase/mannose-1-phosphate guanylyltransferase/mannose-6-phosphate isomerase